MAVGNLNHLRDWRNRSERVRHLRCRRELGARREEFFVLGKDNLPALVNRRNLDDRACFLGDKLPRHDVRVVFQERQNDFVARRKILLDIGSSHKVDCLGRAAHKNDVLRARRSDKVRHGLPRLLHRVGGAVGKFMHAAVDIGVLVLVVMHKTVDDGFRPLRGRAVV